MLHGALGIILQRTVVTHLPGEPACARPLVCVPPGLTTDSQRQELLSHFTDEQTTAAGA